jgi:hypothetical protein
VSIFNQYLSEAHACITGSIFLQLLLGEHVFLASHMDIFVPNTSCCPTLSLHKFLFEVHIKNGSFQSHSDARWPCREPTFIVKRLDGTYVSGSFSAMVSVTTYHTVASRFRVFVFSDKRKSQNIVKKYIQENFDFCSCMGFFDGNQLQLPCIGDICRRELQTTEKHNQRIAFMNPIEVKQYQEHSINHNYQTRGFHLKDNITYAGKYFNKLDQLELRPFQRYTTQYLTRLCERDLPRRKRKHN